MNRTAVEQIKERLPIEDVVSSYVKLEKAGKSFKGRCPFHNEKSASFFVSPDRGGYYCFGCGAKGDIFTFVEQFEGLDFRGALKVLAEKAGVKLTFDPKAEGERDRLLRVMEDAAKYFEDELAKSDQAMEYVKNRGISEETRAEFRIGWAPEGWNNLSKYLKIKGHSEITMEKAGLIKKPENDEVREYKSTNYYDRFRGRIIFPIEDSSGRVIAFSGRILKDDGKSAKYLNSPDTPLYDKSSVLYGLDKAKSEIRRLNYAVLVEGQMDLVLSHQSGVKNTVASSGTALGNDAVNKEGAINNLGLLRRLTPNIVIAFDSDSAGKKAALRAAGIALSLGMDVKIADIKDGKDPADLVKENPEEWKKTLRNTKSVIEFELDNIISEEKDPRKISKALSEKILPLVINIEQGIERDHFVKMISDKARVSIDLVWNDLKIVERKIKEALSKKQGDQSTQSGLKAKSSFEMTRRIDIVERRLFGLINLMKNANFKGYEDFEKEAKSISGDLYEAIKARAESDISDLMFEAEAFFGSDQKNWLLHMKELLINFEDDLINEELVNTMSDLKEAERAGNQDLVAELAKKCQVLSIRKAQVMKKRTAK